VFEVGSGKGAALRCSTTSIWSRSAEHQGCDGRHPACAHVRGFGAL